MLLCPNGMLATSCRAVYLGRGFFFFLPRQGGGLQLARSSLPSGDTCSLVIALRISISTHRRGIPHASQRVQFTHNSCWEIPGDFTCPRNLHGLPCRPARACCPGGSLRAFRERNMRRAARDASHTRSQGDPCLPNSNNTRHHFSRPRGLVESHVEHFRAGFLPRRRAREGRSLNVKRSQYETSRETGVVPEILTSGPFGSLHPSPV